MAEDAQPNDEAATPWRWDIFTLFPQWFGWLNESRPTHNVMENGGLDLNVHDLREHAPDKHRHIDDMPYGGGPGMVIRVDIVMRALESTLGMDIDTIRDRHRIVLLSPAGRQFDDQMSSDWATEQRPTIVLCGRYEGFDHRVHEHIATEEISLGPFVLSGGEIPAMAMLDAACRKLPGALGNTQSLVDETFSPGVAGGSEYPHYTRPAEFRGWPVPDVLLSGHHGQIDEWRAEQSVKRTNDADQPD